MSTLFQPSTYSTAVVFLRSYFRPRDQLARLRSRVFQSWRVSSDCRCCKFPAEHKEVSCYAVLFFNREHVWLDQRAATWGSQHRARKKVCLHSRLSLSLAAKPLSVFVKWKPLRQISLTFSAKMIWTFWRLKNICCTWWTRVTLVHAVFLLVSMVTLFSLSS